MVPVSQQRELRLGVDPAVTLPERVPEVIVQLLPCERDHRGAHGEDDRGDDPRPEPERKTDDCDDDDHGEHRPIVHRDERAARGAEAAGQHIETHVGRVMLDAAEDGERDGDDEQERERQRRLRPGEPRIRDERGVEAGSDRDNQRPAARRPEQPAADLGDQEYGRAREERLHDDDRLVEARGVVREQPAERRQHHGVAARVERSLTHVDAPAAGKVAGVREVADFVGEDARSLPRLGEPQMDAGNEQRRAQRGDDPRDAPVDRVHRRRRLVGRARSRDVAARGTYHRGAEATTVLKQRTVGHRLVARPRCTSQSIVLVTACFESEAIPFPRAASGWLRRSRRTDLAR